MIKLLAVAKTLYNKNKVLTIVSGLVLVLSALGYSTGWLQSIQSFITANATPTTQPQ